MMSKDSVEITGFVVTRKGQPSTEPLGRDIDGNYFAITEEGDHIAFLEKDDDETVAALERDLKRKGLVLHAAKLIYSVKPVSSKSPAKEESAENKPTPEVKLDGKTWDLLQEYIGESIREAVEPDYESRRRQAAATRLYQIFNGLSSE